MNVFRTIRNYLCYCGIEKSEYNAIKKDAYISNYRVWRILQIVMVIVFGIFFVGSFFAELMKANRAIYLAIFLYSLVSTGILFILKKDSLIAQLLIYLSISVLFLFAGFISQNTPQLPATTFIVFLLIAPMFMIDKPYFMSIVLCIASAVFLIWMHRVKPYEIWRYDLASVIIYMCVGIFLHIIANSLRIKEFVLTRALNIQKDLDELSGLKNKDALTRAINEYMADDLTDKGLMFILDVDRFKTINDTYGHDVGDSVIHQIGCFLRGLFTQDEIIGRFGGDEFIVFLKGTDDTETARSTANAILTGAPKRVALPDNGQTISISIGIAIYNGDETNYSALFKKADTAMYQAKADPESQFHIYE